MSALKMILISEPAMPSRNPLCRSWPGVDVCSPLNSITFPFPPSALTIHSPAALPIFLLSAPMKQVYLSPSKRRSSTMIGMPASSARATGSVSGCASFGLTMSKSTLELTNSSICARCCSVSFCASLKIIFSSGCFTAAAATSAFICTRHGSPRLHCDMPMVNCFCGAEELRAAGSVDLPQPVKAIRAKAPSTNIQAPEKLQAPNFKHTAGGFGRLVFGISLELGAWSFQLSYSYFSSGLILFSPLRQNRRHDDDASEHQPPRFGNGVDAQNFVEVADGQNAEQRQADAAPLPHQTRPADHHHRNRDQFITGPGFRVALLFLRRLADAGDGGAHS